MEQWKEYKLGDICKTNISQYSAKENWDNALYLDTGNITDNKINEIVTINDMTHGLPSRARRKVKDKDILFSTVRPNQRHIGILQNPQPNLLVSTGFTVISANQDVADPYFLYYFLSQKEIVDYLHAIAEQAVSAYPSIKASDIEDLDILLPELSQQKKISELLKSLDDKIELNRQINDNLEQQAQALFKSWFVDFEPFKDGEFVDSELGMIPKGWKIGELGEVAEFKRGKTITQKDTVFGTIPVIAGGLEPAYYHNKANTSAPVVTISASGANAGYTQILFEDVWASDCSFIDSTCECILFAYCFLSINSRILRHAQVGAAQPHVYAKDVNAFALPIPNDTNIIKHFILQIEPIFEMMGNLRSEIKELAQLRDTLLPRLMSGELKINEINC